MAKESQQHALDRVRSPRVQLTYDVETLGAKEKRELPFVVGVMSELSGDPLEKPKKLKDRNFVNIDRDNFNKVLEGMKPRLVFKVDNRLQNDGTRMGVELEFRHMEDFSPYRVAQQVPALKKLLTVRARLKELTAKVSNDELAEMLEQIIGDTEKMSRLQRHIEQGTSGAGASR